MSSSSFFLFVCVFFFRVISGEEEGVFGWITANHLAQTLLGTTAVSYGTLDLGGASTQVN